MEHSNNYKSNIEDVHPELKSEKFEDLLIELRDVINEDYCRNNFIDYNLGAIVSSPIEVLHLAIEVIKKAQEKE